MRLSLSFPEGPLGITITPSERGVVVTDIKTQCRHSARLQVGDVVSFVNGKQVGRRMDGASFDRLVTALRERPMTIDFERRLTTFESITHDAQALLLRVCEEDEDDYNNDDIGTQSMPTPMGNDGPGKEDDNNDDIGTQSMPPTVSMDDGVPEEKSTVVITIDDDDDEVKEEPAEEKKKPPGMTEAKECLEAKVEVEREWSELRRGVVAAAVKIAEERGTPTATMPGGVALPGLAGPGAFVHDQKVDEQFKKWDPHRLEFSYQKPMPGLVAMPGTTKEMKRDPEYKNDDGVPVFDHIILLGARPTSAKDAVKKKWKARQRSVAATTETQVLHDYPSKGTPAELAATVCSFCAPSGVGLLGEVGSRKDEKDHKETQRFKELRRAVHVFGAGDRPLYAITFKGLTRRDSYTNDDEVLVVRSELRIVILTRRASLLALHFSAGTLLGRDVGAAVSAAVRAHADPDTISAAAAAALNRFACAYTRVHVGAPGVRTKWTPPPPLDEAAFDNTTVAENHREHRDDVVFVRARGDVEAGQSVWDGDGAAVLEWALPILFQRLRLNLVLRALAALLAEVTVVVECADEADLSACVLGLVTLAKPLHPAGPLIVVLPDQYLDYLDSPVPVVLGVAKAPLDKVGSPSAIPGLLVKCDDNDTVLFGGATPDLVGLPAEKRVLKALAVHAQTLRSRVNSSSSSSREQQQQQALVVASSSCRGKKSSFTPDLVGRRRFPQQQQQQSRIGGHVALALAKQDTKRARRSRSVPPDSRFDGIAVRDALREVARTITHHVAVLAAAALELAERRNQHSDRKPSWLLDAALGSSDLPLDGDPHQSTSTTTSSISRDAASLPPFTTAFIKSQLFANFRNSLDRDGGPAWIRRLAAALRPQQHSPTQRHQIILSSDSLQPSSVGSNSSTVGFYSIVAKALRHHTVHRPVIRSGQRRRSTRGRRLWWALNRKKYSST